MNGDFGEGAEIPWDVVGALAISLPARAAHYRGGLARSPARFRGLSDESGMVRDSTLPPRYSKSGRWEEWKSGRNDEALPLFHSIALALLSSQRTWLSR